MNSNLILPANCNRHSNNNNHNCNMHSSVGIKRCKVSRIHFQTFSNHLIDQIRDEEALRNRLITIILSLGIFCSTQRGQGGIGCWAIAAECREGGVDDGYAYGGAGGLSKAGRGADAPISRASQQSYYSIQSSPLDWQHLRVKLFNISILSNIYNGGKGNLSI